MDYGCLTFRLRAGREEEYKRREVEIVRVRAEEMSAPGGQEVPSFVGSGEGWVKGSCLR